MAFSFRSFYYKQQEFSETTFGPGDRTNGVIAHIRSELVEVEEQYDLLLVSRYKSKIKLKIASEIADIIILAIDLAWRLGLRSSDIESALTRKLLKNKNRQWPDWRTMSKDEPIEHIRGIHD